MTLTPQAQALLETCRVGHLATASADGQPHCVPVCFVYDGDSVWIALDEKPKTVDVSQLKRVRNVQQNPRVSLLLDHYDEDWTRLAWVMVQGRAALTQLTPPVVHALHQKYPQYLTMHIEHALRITPDRFRYWHSGERES